MDFLVQVRGVVRQIDGGGGTIIFTKSTYREVSASLRRGGSVFVDWRDRRDFGLFLRESVSAAGGHAVG